MTHDAETEVALILRAASFAAGKHRTQKRKGADGLPYITHPLAVAGVLAGVGGVTEVTTLVAALLHDTVEDTGTLLEDLEAEFGREVACWSRRSPTTRVCPKMSASGCRSSTPPRPPMPRSSSS